MTSSTGLIGNKVGKFDQHLKNLNDLYSTLHWEGQGTMRFFAYFPLFWPKKPVFLLFFGFFEVEKNLYSQDSFSSLRNVPVSVFNEPSFFFNTATTALIDKRSRAKHGHGSPLLSRGQMGWSVLYDHEATPPPPVSSNLA